MSLTVKHLNADASFLLTFRPIVPFPPAPGGGPHAFTIAIDPWLSGTSKIWHRLFSLSAHQEPSCVASLRDIPELDLVIVSQDKTDHCHEGTLKQLPAYGGKTKILAESGAAKTIKGWKYFDPSKVISLDKWEGTRIKRDASVLRIPIPPIVPNGAPGEVTVVYISQKLDVTGLHSAIAITYRPPSTASLSNVLPLTPPGSPRSFQSDFSTTNADRALSVIYSPHGIPYKDVAPYASQHLVREAALPLTALLHCFDRVNNPWWLGGNICSGFPGGLEIAQALLAKAWISAHDEVKDTKGFASTRIMTTRFAREEVEKVVSPVSSRFGTDAVVLDVGQEIVLSQGANWEGDGLEKRCLDPCLQDTP